MSLNEALIHSSAGMRAESARISAAASNIASANSESTNLGGAYKAQKVVFKQVVDAVSGVQTVRAVGVVNSAAEHTVRYQPGHPLADENGFVYGSNVSLAEEMTDLSVATQSFETNALVANAVQTLHQKTLQLGK